MYFLYFFFFCRGYDELFELLLFGQTSNSNILWAVKNVRRTRHLFIYFNLGRSCSMPTGKTTKNAPLSHRWWETVCILYGMQLFQIFLIVIYRFAGKKCKCNFLFCTKMTQSYILLRQRLPFTRKIRKTYIYDFWLIIIVAN